MLLCRHLPRQLIRLKKNSFQCVIGGGEEFGGRKRCFHERGRRVGSCTTAMSRGLQLHRRRQNCGQQEAIGMQREATGAKFQRTKYSVSLSRDEIEEDFLELTRRRPARKPKKRTKYIQKQLDTLFPGLWLSEITPDVYKVNKNPEEEGECILYRRIIEGNQAYKQNIKTSTGMDFMSKELYWNVAATIPYHMSTIYKDEEANRDPLMALSMTTKQTLVGVGG